MQDANNAREKLLEILNDKEYQVYYNESKSILTIWWEKAKGWLAEQLGKLVPSLESAESAAAPILIIIMIAVILLLGVVTYILIRNSRHRRTFRDHKPLHSLRELNWTYQKHLSEASRLEALEEFSQSTRHLFLALLLYFHENEWLEARIWKTNWEYYNELEKVNKQWADQFYSLASIFDGVTYGEKQVQRQEYLRFRSDVMMLLNGDQKMLKEI